jgi:hypothetical protein
MLTFGVIAAVVALLALGAGLATLLVFPVVAIGQRLALPPRTKTVVESAALPFSCQSVWNLIHPADNAPIMSAQFVRGYRVPGTPDGVGERQAFEQVDGTTVIVEVIESAQGRRAVTIQISPQPAVQQQTVFDLTPTDSGCVLQLSLEIQLPRGKRLVHGAEATVRASFRDNLARVNATLTANAWAPPLAPPSTPR